MSGQLNVNYEKRNNLELFKTFRNNKDLSLLKVQNYIPIYNNFFSFNETNYNVINLNNKFYISSLLKQVENRENVFTSILKNTVNETTLEKEIFIKYAPLIDPFKYLVGKYNINDDKLFKLPKFNSTDKDVHYKFIDKNNSSYIDSLFSFLSSKIIHKYNFIHGVDYYGSFLAIKSNYKVNIIDDIEYLCKSDYFNKYKNVDFKVDDFNFLLDNVIDSRKKPIKIDNEISLFPVETIDDSLFEDLFDTKLITLDDLKNNSLELIDVTNSSDFSLKQDNKSTTIKSSSTCSSRSSHTSVSDEYQEQEEFEELEENYDDDENVEDEEDGDEDSENSEDSVDKINATIPKFPVNLICMENCESTLDDLIINNELNNDEWFSALMQVIMILITYQKCFSFTHNDLHTNNIMYNKTEKKYIYYHYNKKYYKVPTFGRIFKIIDFGRSIYTYNEILFCSDSFEHGGDASTQYNFEPYFNNKKPRLEPNYSFDLCRLACSIFDYLIDDLDDIKDLNSCSNIIKLIVDWCTDDNNMNILYKTNGAERYPEFKLYKMISRCVHKHTPHAQLERKEFSSYLVKRSDLPKKFTLVNVDEMPIFTI
jgi:hypothetical protein